MAGVYGSPNVSVFLREFVETVVSCDQNKIAAFNGRLIERATGQLVLKLRVDAERAAMASHPAYKGKRKGKRARAT